MVLANLRTITPTAHLSDATFRSDERLLFGIQFAGKSNAGATHDIERVVIQNTNQTVFPPT